MWLNGCHKTKFLCRGGTCAASWRCPLDGQEKGEKAKSERRKRSFRFSFSLNKTLTPHYRNSIPEICFGGPYCCPLDLVIIVEDETLVFRKRANIDMDSTQGMRENHPPASIRQHALPLICPPKAVVLHPRPIPRPGPAAMTCFEPDKEQKLTTSRRARGS
jgi:hypothetical protein